MNDFTKEELEQLAYLARCSWKNGDEPEEGEPHIYDTYLKIISMIENYCEHEFNTLKVTNKKIIQCKKCKKIAWLED